MTYGDALQIEPMQLERLRVPLDWHDLNNESPLKIRQKIETAKLREVAAVIWTARDVRERVRDMALIEASTNKTPQNVHAALLRGVGPFAGLYFPEITSADPNQHPHVDFMKVTRFLQKQTGLKIPMIDLDLQPATYEYADSATIDDEVGDEGITVDFVRNHIDARWQKFHPGKSLKFGLRLLVDKGIADYSAFEPDDIHIGFTGPVAWLSGMGMDGLGEKHRWSPDIYLSGTQDEKYREAMPEILEALGERAVMTMNNINWV